MALQLVVIALVRLQLGGWLDRTLVLLMVTLYTLPMLLLSVVLAFLLGKGLPKAAAVLGVV
jgi:peptide/nickel transport system permease protein